jgi:hypothetical protein
VRCRRSGPGARRRASGEGRTAEAAIADLCEAPAGLIAEFGVALVFGSFGDMLIVALFGAIGYGIAKVLSGDVDVPGWLARSRSGR